MPIDFSRKKKNELLVKVDQGKMTLTFDSFFASVYAK